MCICQLIIHTGHFHAKLILQRVHVLSMLRILVFYTIPYQLMLVSFNSNTAGVIVLQERLITRSAWVHHRCLEGSCWPIFGFLCNFVSISAWFFFFFVWSLHCLSIDLRFLVTPWESSNVSKLNTNINDRKFVLVKDSTYQSLIHEFNYNNERFHT